MSRHCIYIDISLAEELVDLPEGVFIRGARVVDGDLVLVVDSTEDLGAIEVDAVYAGRDQTSFEPRPT